MLICDAERIIRIAGSVQKVLTSTLRISSISCIRYKETLILYKLTIDTYEVTSNKWRLTISGQNQNPHKCILCSATTITKLLNFSSASVSSFFEFKQMLVAQKLFFAEGFCEWILYNVVLKIVAEILTRLGSIRSQSRDPVQETLRHSGLLI